MHILESRIDIDHATAFVKVSVLTIGTKSELIAYYILTSLADLGKRDIHEIIESASSGALYTKSEAEEVFPSVTGRCQGVWYYL